MGLPPLRRVGGAVERIWIGRDFNGGDGHGRFFAVVMIAGGAFLLWDPLGGAALQGQLWQTSAGLAGAVTGLTLWLRNL